MERTERSKSKWVEHRCFGLILQTGLVFFIHCLALSLIFSLRPAHGMVWDSRKAHFVITIYSVARSVLTCQMANIFRMHRHTALHIKIVWWWTKALLKERGERTVKFKKKNEKRTIFNRLLFYQFQGKWIHWQCGFVHSVDDGGEGSSRIPWMKLIIAF